MSPSLRFVPTRAPFARPSPSATKFPGVLALIGPSDSLTTFGLSSGSPCCRPTSWTVAYSYPGRAGACSRDPVGDWSPALRSTGLLPSRSSQDLPVYCAVPSVRAPFDHSARCVHLSPSSEMDTAAFRRFGTLGTWNVHIFGADSAAHTPACLRINEPITRNAARLASGPPGSALAGWGSHPLDDSSDFVELSSPPFVSDQQGLVASEN